MTRILALTLLFLALPYGVNAESLVIHVGPLDPGQVTVTKVSSAEAIGYLTDTTGFDVVAANRMNVGDVSGDGRVATSDIIFLVQFVLKSGAAPPSPAIAQTRLVKMPDGRYEMWHVYVDSTGAAR